VYRTADGRHLSLGGSELKFAENLLQALGRPDLIALCKQPPGPAQDPVKDFLRTTFATRTLAEWDAWFAGVDVCYAPVRTLYEALREPHLLERGMRLRDAEGNDHLGVPIRFQEEPAQPRFELPQPGAHGAALLRELGYDATQIERLREDRALG
jgi:crotonobetainyl-CoA:carnitine CoA-transferase CaiB-like acyl-CoA transferase